MGPIRSLAKIHPTHCVGDSLDSPAGRLSVGVMRPSPGTQQDAPMPGELILFLALLGVVSVVALKETIGIGRAYEIVINELGCRIPERPDLEFFHEERNDIQHKYANPSVEDASFHLDDAMKFIQRFVKDELKLDIANFIPLEFLEDFL